MNRYAVLLGAAGLVIGGFLIGYNVEHEFYSTGSCSKGAAGLTAFACWIAPTVWGLLAVLLLYGVAVYVTKSLNPLVAVLGNDPATASSQLVFAMWTVTFVFAYVVLYSDRLQHSAIDPLYRSIPHNILILMGISVATVVIDKTKSSSDRPAVRAARESRTALSLSDALTAPPARTPALTNIQMVTWSFIGVVSYLIVVYATLELHTSCAPILAGTPPCIPDVDTALLVLLGLSQGAYVGGRLVGTDVAGVPVIDHVIRADDATSTKLTITGRNFGSRTGELTIAGKAVQSTWTDTQIGVAQPLGSIKTGDTIVATALVPLSSPPATAP